ncbi:MAG: AAA family ATPase [Gemmatimonadaceae bacterium]|nr:AAA family ATPase [Gemmatimonadaceae bacterium]
MRSRHGTPGSPFLTHIALRDDRVSPGYPFDLPVLRDGFQLELTTPVTILVGENGSGKSTLLEAMAWAVGFGAHGGSRDHRFDADADADADGHVLGRALRLGWRQRVTNGFFHRAETFYNFATALEQSGSTFARYGGESLHTRSHGEAFLALFEHRFEDGFYILDEPEAALSPQRQLALMRILHDLTVPRTAQFVIATHSPFLLAFPGTTILSLDGGQLREVRYDETEHVQLTRSFLESPERFLRHLLAD